MGYNTVAVLFNDHFERFEQGMPRLATAMESFHARERSSDSHFGCGQIISQDHADATQVVVVSRNTGQAVNWREGDKASLDALAVVLRQRGYAVREPGSNKLLCPYEWNRENWVSPED